MSCFSLVTIAAIALGAAPARADETPASSNPAVEQPAPQQKLLPRLERRMKFLDENLKLSAEQKEKIAAIWNKANEQLQDERDSAATMTRRARRKKYREVMQGVHDQVRGVLTPEQQKVFDTLPPQSGRRARRTGSEV